MIIEILAVDVKIFPTGGICVAAFFLAPSLHPDGDRGKSPPIPRSRGREESYPKPSPARGIGGAFQPRQENLGGKIPLSPPFSKGD